MHSEHESKIQDHELTLKNQKRFYQQKDGKNGHKSHRITPEPGQAGTE
jgi:hypothetical protein